MSTSFGEHERHPRSTKTAARSAEIGAAQDPGSTSVSTSIARETGQTSSFRDTRTGAYDLAVGGPTYAGVLGGQIGVNKGKGKAREGDLDGPTSTSSAFTALAPRSDSLKDGELVYREFDYEEKDLAGIMRLCEQELSEPYNLYTYRYFLQDWPHLTLLVYSPSNLRDPVGCILCKQDIHRGKSVRGYIAMLSVDKAWRRRGIASTLVRRIIARMKRDGAQEVVLETEYDNAASLRLYEHLGFFREKRLHRFYSNGKDAFRLYLPLSTDLYEEPFEATEAREAVSRAPELEAMMQDDGLMQREDGRGRMESILEENEEVRMGDTPFPPILSRAGHDWGERSARYADGPGTADWYSSTDNMYT